MLHGKKDLSPCPSVNIFFNWVKSTLFIKYHHDQLTVHDEACYQDSGQPDLKYENEKTEHSD